MDPVCSSKCSHTFCSACIVEHARSSASNMELQDDVSAASSTFRPLGRTDPLISCPSCRCLAKQSEYTPSPQLVKNMVDSLIVLCPMVQRGCDWTGERCTADYHLRKECGFVYVGEFDAEGCQETRTSKSILKEEGHSGSINSTSAPSGACDCGAAVLRKDWVQHKMSGCASRWCKCQWCQELVLSGEGKVSPDSPADSHTSVCRSYPLPCEHCSESVTRSSMTAHLDEDCPQKPVICPMARFGCAWKGPREKLGDIDVEESESNLQASHHLVTCSFYPLRSFLETSSARLQALESENEQLRDQVSRQQASLAQSQRQIDGCLTALGRWAPPSNDSNSVSSAWEDDTGQTDAATAFDSGITVEFTLPSDWDAGYIDWPATSRDPADQRSSRSNGGARSSSSSSSGPRTARRFTEPPNLEETMSRLSATTSRLDTQHGNLSRLISDSRREGVVTNMEVGRLSEELSNLRMCLHSVACHVQLRGRSTSFGLNSGSKEAEARNVRASATSSKGTSDAVPLPDDGLSTSLPEVLRMLSRPHLAGSSPGPSSHYPFAGGFHNYHSHAYGAGSPGGLQGMGPYGQHLPFGGLPPPPLQQPQHHQTFSHNYVDYRPTPPAPNLRRFWSGLEQTKL